MIGETLSYCGWLAAGMPNGITDRSRSSDAANCHPLGRENFAFNSVQ